jgi:hypothetical protein
MFLAQQHLALNSLEESSGVFLKTFLIPREDVTQGHPILDTVDPGLHTIVPGYAVGNYDRRDIVGRANKSARLVRAPKT